jgi:hypothetical protein
MFHLENMMTEFDAFETLRQWAQTQGMNTDSIGDGWTAAAHKNSWVLTPRGRSNAVYIVTSMGVRPVTRSMESLVEVLASLD